MSTPNQRILAAAVSAAIGSAAAAWLPSAGVWAQTAEAPSAALEEVVITAERREASVLTTPIAITAVTGEQLAEEHLTTIADLQSTVPDLSVTTNGAFAVISIRGIGGSISPASAAGVGVYRDGLFEPETTGLNEPFFDIQDVEVLKGPQGTFVGANSTGGAIQINSRDPVIGDKVDGYVETVLGTYTDTKIDGAVNLPISDTLAARIAFNSETRHSFFKNVATPGPTGDGQAQSPPGIAPSSYTLSDPGSLDDRNVRLGLLWKPSDAFQALLKIEYDQSANQGDPFEPNPNTFTDPVSGAVVHSPYYAFGTQTPYRINPNVDYQQDSNYAWRGSLELKYTLPDGITLRSLSGYQNTNNVLISDDDASSANATLTRSFVGPDDNYYSEEIDLISPSAGPLTWIAGAAMYYEDTPVHIESYTFGVPYSVAAPQVLIANMSNLSHIEGLFGQVSYQINDALQLQIGARENWATKYGNGGGQLTIPLPPPFPTLQIPLPNNSHYGDSAPTGKVGLNWEPIKGQFFYLFYARGYKAGGFNQVGPSFGPEYVNDYELGWKAQLFDGHLQTQLGGYYMAYNGYQMPIYSIPTGTTQTVNLSPTKIDGFEASAKGIFGGFGIDLGVAYTHSALGSTTAVADYELPAGIDGSGTPQCAGTATPPACFNYAPYTQNVSGEQNPLAPKLVVKASVGYAIPVGGNILRPKVTYSHIDEQYATIFQQNNYYLLAARNLLDASLNYEAGPWTAQLYGRNLTNRVYIEGIGGGINEQNNVMYGDPRVFGIRVSRQF